MLLKSIERALASSSHHHELKEIMHYAVLPAGKLFRPRLVEALALDLSHELTKDHQHLAAAIELHHAYTLVHDDLPAMDNDAMRRGKPSTHAKFGEWKAILAGDALLIASFEELMRIDHPRVRELHRLFSWATGARGLISGQFLDLSADGKLDMGTVLRIHELKTARLIQVATLGCFFLSDRTQSIDEKKDFLRLGREIGVSFQLLDDLSELTESELSPHEKLINPFLISPAEAMNALTRSHLRLMKLIKERQLTNLSPMMEDYFRSGQKNLLTHITVLENHINENVFGDVRNWITSFA